MSKEVLRVAITGAAGQIAYSLLFRIATGEAFGADQPIAFHLLELPQAQTALQGVMMELDDAAFPLLKEIHSGSDPRAVFEGVDWALLVGAKPRSKGMERAHLLRDNAKIFVEQGRALGETASKEVKVLVVGNPCNTNCWIALQNAKHLPRENFHAMTRLDQNRATAQLAQRAGCPVSAVSRVAIWGNHSATQVPDFLNARIDGKPALHAIHERQWLEGPFLETIQKRGAAIIAARGQSSAASAASAIVDAVKSLVTKTPKDAWFSSAVYSTGNPYGIAEDLVCGFPLRSHGHGKWEIVPDLPWDDFLKERIAITEQELIAEREEVKPLL